MKAEKRHQLQRNALADRMGRLFETMKSSPRSSSTLVWAFIIVTLATLVLWQYGAHANQSRYSALWTQVDVAGRDWERGPMYLARISDDSRGSLPGRAAGFEVARKAFADGQFPIEAVDELYKQMIPDLNSTLPMPNPTWKNMAALAVKLKGAVLIGHSESGFFPEQAALIDPTGIKGMISIEMGDQNVVDLLQSCHLRGLKNPLGVAIVG